jgi:large subunit ribosomal protein L7/L12
MAYFLVLSCFIALLYVRRIHRRGQTIAEAMAAGRAEQRRRAEAREREREAVVALPWVQDKRLSLDAVPGVLIAPAPDVPGYHVAGHDIVLDSAGDEKLHVVRQIMRLTRVRPKEARHIVDNTPVTVLRVPDIGMAHAARSMLEIAGATVTISNPSS